MTSQSTDHGPKYDENLEENPFLLELRASFPELLEKAISENWLLSVPRSDTLPSELNLRPEDVCRHILVPEAAGGGKYYSLADKRLLINDKNILQVFDPIGKFELSRNLLFSEVFYDDDLRKYKVLCLSGYLGEDPRFSSQDALSSTIKLSSTSQCIQYLFQNLEPESLRKIEASVSKAEKTPLENILKSSLKRVPQNSDPLLRPSLETYILFLIHANIIENLKNTYNPQNAALNRVIMLYASKEVFGAQMNNEKGINSRAKSELIRLDQSSTPLDKLECLSRVLGALGKFESSDELLQMLIGALSKTPMIKDWYSQLIYMKDYRVSSVLRTGEYNYLLATLEAALEHLLSEDTKVCPSISIQSDDSETTELFSAVIASNLDYVKSTLSLRGTASHDAHHPLCNCDSCHEKSSHLSINYQENKFGFTLLHVAALKGDSQMVDALLDIFKADPATIDIKSRTPLHLACMFGHQSVILLIIQSTPSVLNSQDQDGRTPLHLASLYGHESSAKGLLYFAEHQSYPLEIDSQDKFGDTPLHLGSSSGHKSIVRLLLEYSAKPLLRNKRGLTPSECSLCSKIRDLIQDYEQTERVNFFEAHQGGSTKAALEDNNTSNEEESPLSPHKSKSDRFFKSIMMGDLELACHCLGINAGDETFRSRVLYSSPCYPSCGGCEDCKELLLSESSCHVKESLTRPKSPPFHLNSLNSEGKTGVQLTAQLGQSDILGILLQLGADPWPVSEDTGETPLHLISQNGHLGALKVLSLNESRFKSHVDDGDHMGNTALMYAASSGHYDIALKLLSLGASIKVRNLAGDSALDIAKRHDNHPLALLFQKYC